MKKIRFFAICAAAAALTACEVAEEFDQTPYGLISPDETVSIEEPRGETFVFTSDPEDSEGLMTRTEHDGSRIIWSAGDKIRMGMTINDTWQAPNGDASSYTQAKLYASQELTSGGLTAAFTVPTNFSSTGSGTYKFYTIYPAAACSENGFSANDVLTVNIPSEQTPAAASFDPAADLMVGASVKTYTSKPTEAIPLMWERLVAHGEITLKNLQDLTSGETVESVTLTAQNDAHLTGYYSVNLKTATVTGAVNASNSVTVSGDNLAFDSNNLTFWIGILPATLTSLKVELETSAATYTREISSCNVTFAGNAHNKLGINMAGATRTATTVPAYVKVTQIQTDWSGQYVLGYNNGSVKKMLTGISDTSTKYGIATDVAITDDTITYEDGHPYEITIAKSGSYYTMSLNGVGYLGWNSGNSLITVSSPTDNQNGGLWSISYDDGKLTIINVNTLGTTNERLLQYNSGSPRFACYTSAQQAPSLYKLTSSGGTTPDPQPEATATVTTEAAGNVVQTSATLNGSFSGATGTISEVGFYWGTTNNPATKVVATGTTSPFTYALSGLTAGTTYYYKAYVKEYNAATASVEERTGSVQSFTTEAATPTTQYYEKITSAPADWSGEYLIVYEEGSLAFNGGLTSLNQSGNSISVTIRNSKIEKTSTTSAAQFTISKSGNNYTIQSASGYYIGQTSDSNGLLFDQTLAYTNTISLSDNNVNIVSSGGAYLRYNDNTNNGRVFRYYKSSTYTNQKAICLYKLGGSSSGGDTPAAATATVTTATAYGVNATSATLSGSYSGATGEISQRGFYWGTSSNPTTRVISSGSGTSFTYSLSGLTSGQTYYYKAFVVEYNASAGTTEERFGSVLSFVAQAPSVNTPPGYLGCYEMPEVSLNGTTSNGNETYGSTKWWEYDTTTSTRKVITHTYAYSSTQYRNYTAMIDKDKRCPLWTAYVIHRGAYPDNNIGRVGDWTYDPGIPRAWQSSGSTSDYNSGNGYGRGHHCASNDRQTSSDANKQTFYYTNQSPQWQNNFNSGIWSSLEEAVQSSAPSGRDTLYVVVGTLFETGNTGSSNDGGTVGRPSHFYKLLMKCSFNTSGAMTTASGTAFIYTNEAHPSNKTKPYNDASYVTTIDAIETRAGFNFFANVPSALQENAENGTSKLTL